MKVPAWQGDWEKRIYDRVRGRDFATLTDLADKRPTATLKELASDLGPDRDVAAVQLERVLRREAQETGRIHRFARSALVRQIHEHFPQGWMRANTPSPGPSSPNEWCRASVYATWRGRLGEEYDAETDRVFDTLERIAPLGWLPAGPDDPIIEQAFKEGGFPGDAEPGGRGERGGSGRGSKG